MSNINSIVAALFEEKGFAGVEMFNVTYPSIEDNGGVQKGSNPAGTPALSIGGDCNFSKTENIDYHPSSKGKPNLSVGGSSDYAKFLGYPNGGAGKPAVMFNN